MKLKSLFVTCLFIFPVTQGYTPKRPSSLTPSFVTRQDICGIWKLCRLQPSKSRPTDDDSAGMVGDDDEIVLRLNNDGTFDPYTTLPTKEDDDDVYESPQDVRDILCYGGCWEYRDSTLLLAADRRPKKSRMAQNDTLFVGKLSVQVSECLSEGNDKAMEQDKEEKQGGPQASSSEDAGSFDMDAHLSIPQGQISTGRFMYPKKHKAFFEEPILFRRCEIGSFHMNQILGNLNARLRSKREEEAAEMTRNEAKFHKHDFYNRTFYLTATPHPINPAYAAHDSRYDETKAVMDVRVMPITFFPNNTFAAIGTEKILRGRYGLTGKRRDKLWFQVSLFGAGRSAPGSVYSEGRLLSKDDQRGYVGPIQAYPNRRNETIYFVDGEFYYGVDVKNPRKNRSWGSFALQEVDNDDQDLTRNDDRGNDNPASWDDEEEDDAFQ